MRYLFIAAAIIIGCTYDVSGQEKDSIKKYSLFHPAPREKMREMQTDRPDVTESAYTVDVGHFQVESDILKLIRNTSNGISSHTNYYNLINLKAGLTNSTDLQLVVESYVKNEVKEPFLTSNQSGFGNLTVRLKQNIWGNTSGKSALALMPYLSVPTSRFEENKKLGGGLIVPFALELKNGWSFSSQAAIDFEKPETTRSYQTELLTSATLGREIIPKLNGFMETYDTYAFADDKFDLFLDGGLIYSLTDNFKMDAGINYGVTKSSDKVYFIGFSFRY